jgi:hypothetical protein
VKDLDVSLIFDFFPVHEVIQYIQAIGIGFYAFIRSFQCVVTHSADSHDLVIIGFLDTYEVADWGNVMDQIICGKRKDGPAAVPPAKLFDFYPDGIQRAYG